MLLPFSVVVASVWLGLLFLNRDSPRDSAITLRDYVAGEFAVTQDIYVRFLDLGLRFPDLVEAAQAQLDHRLKEDHVLFKYHLVNELPQKIKRPRNELYETAELDITDAETSAEDKSSPETALSGFEIGNQTVVGTHTTINSTVDGDLLPAEDSLGEDKLLSSRTLTANSSLAGNSSNITAPSTEIPEFHYETWDPEYSVNLALSDEVGIWMDLTDLRATLAYSLETCHTNDLPFFLTQAVYDNLLAADLKQYQTMEYGRFFQYKPQLALNFVAAEELGETSQDLKLQINESMHAISAFIAPYVNITLGFHTVDVTKMRVPPFLLTNTSDTLNLFYLTSLAGIANKVQGIHLYHVYKEPEVEITEKDRYGTAYAEQVREANTPRRYNSTDFLSDSTKVLREVLRLPDVTSDNFNLLVDSAMKHETINAIVVVLTQLIDATDFDSDKFQKIARLVDTILTEKKHRWTDHLKTVYAMRT